MDIVKEIGLPAMLGQLAEECAELGKASLKYQRILMGKNPTPVTENKALKALKEEANDVMDCIHLLEISGLKMHDYAQTQMKMKRWERRITEAKNG